MCRALCHHRARSPPGQHCGNRRHALSGAQRPACAAAGAQHAAGLLGTTHRLPEDVEVAPITDEASAPTAAVDAGLQCAQQERSDEWWGSRRCHE